MSLKRKHSSLACVVCAEDYDADSRIPFIGSCGHSLCSICVDSIRNRRCPLCNKARAFTSKKKNFQLIEVITEFKKVPRKSVPNDPKDCRGCGNAIDEEKAFAYVSAAIPDGSLSVESFLEKANMIRYCEDCTKTEEEPERFKKIYDMEKSLMSKQLEASLSGEKALNLALCHEMQEAVSVIWNARSSLEEGFPSTKKFSPDCTEEERKEIEAKANVLLRALNNLCKATNSVLFSVALIFTEFTSLINRFPKTVDYDALDEEIMKKVQLPVNPVQAAVGRPKLPQTAFTFFCKENPDLVGHGQSQAVWDLVEDKSTWISQEIEDVKRYTNEMIAYFSQ